MKIVVSALLLGLLAIAGCKKEGEMPAASLVVATLPFENSTLKIERLPTTLPTWIQAMYFIDASNGIVSTYDGKLYRTSDGGTTWTLQYAYPTTAANMPLVQIRFTSPTVGYVVGGALSCNGAGCPPPGGLILKTTDGGTTWAVVYQASGVAIAALAVNKLDELLAVSNTATARILKSADNGATWAPVASLPYQLTHIAFTRNVGYCTSASGKVIRSLDGGTTWTEVAATFTHPYLNALAVNVGIGYCVAAYGPVYRTADEGQTWTPTAASSFSAEVVNALTPSSALLFGSGRYSGGDFGTFDGSVRQSVDGGSNWTEIELSEVGPIRQTSFYTARNGVAIAGTALLKITVK